MNQRSPTHLLGLLSTKTFLFLGERVQNCC